MSIDFNTEMSLELINFLKLTIDALNSLPKNLNNNEINIEIDEIPVKWYGETIGYIAVSEIDGNYAYFRPEENNV